jgi:hypothetical protein
MTERKLREKHPNLCEVGEDESDNNGCEGALASTDDMASVDWNFDVAGGGGNNRAIGAARRVWVTVKVGQQMIGSIRRE